MNCRMMWPSKWRKKTLTNNQPQQTFDEKLKAQTTRLKKMAERSNAIPKDRQCVTCKSFETIMPIRRSTNEKYPLWHKSKDGEGYLCDQCHGKEVRARLKASKQPRKKLEYDRTIILNTTAEDSERVDFLTKHYGFINQTQTLRFILKLCTESIQGKDET